MKLALVKLFEQRVRQRGLSCVRGATLCSDRGRLRTNVLHAGALWERRFHEPAAHGRRRKKPVKKWPRVDLRSVRRGQGEGARGTESSPALRRTAGPAGSAGVPRCWRVPLGATAPVLTGGMLSFAARGHGVLCPWPPERPTSAAAPWPDPPLPDGAQTRGIAVAVSWARAVTASAQRLQLRPAPPPAALPRARRSPRA